MTDPDDLSLHWWQLPPLWLRQQKLWRDILTRVLAGVITAAIIYIGALMLGYLDSPVINGGALLAVGLSVSALLIAAAAGLLRGLPARRHANLPFASRLIIGVGLAIAAIAIAWGVIVDVVAG